MAVREMVRSGRTMVAWQRVRRNGVSGVTAVGTSDRDLGLTDDSTHLETTTWRQLEDGARIALEDDRERRPGEVVAYCCLRVR